MDQQNQVTLYWNTSAGATSYSVQRSTDNNTWSTIGTPTSTQYTDTTGTVGTIYYYQVAATNGTLSPYTSSLTGISLTPGQTTLSNMRLQVRQRADQANSQFVSDQELNTYIDQSYRELYDLLIEKYGDDYYVANPYTYTLSTNTQAYPLPNDFYKLLLVEVALNASDPNSWVTIKKYNRIQQNLLNFPNVYTFYGVTNLRYRLTGSNLYIIPPPTGGETLRIWYNPRPNQLLNDTDIADMVSGWEEYIVIDAAIKAMVKEESDISALALQKQAIIKRIEEAAENRDVGEPETVSDSRRKNFSWSDDDSWGGGGIY